MTKKKVSATNLYAVTELKKWLECNVDMGTDIHFDDEGKIRSKQALKGLSAILEALKD